MIKFFRKVRQKLLHENKFSKYLIYASGEIVLVVIGILIALQINNANEIRKSHDKEISYLQNIKEDLLINSNKINSLVERRNNRAEFASKLIRHIEGEPVPDWNEFNLGIIKIFTWERFYQHNYTFQELISSGNLSFIQNDSIKTLLFDLETTYKQLKAEEDHWRFDSEELVYKPSYDDLDMHLILRDYSGEKNVLNKEVFTEYLADRKVKNGLVMAKVEFQIMNGHLKQMNRIIEKLLELIDEEITKG